MAIYLSGINLSGGGGAASATSGKLRLIPVDALPDVSVAKRGVIYIVKAAKTTSDNKFDEYYIADTENGPAWEPFAKGVTIDLSGYATKTDLEPFAKKTDLAPLATKQEVNTLVESYNQKLGEIETLVKSYDLDVVSSMLDELNGTANINGQLDELNS